MEEADTYEIIDYIYEGEEIKYTTIESLLNQLYAKGYVKRKKQGRRYRYRPDVEFDEVISQVMGNLFGDYLNHNLTPLVSYIFKTQNLTKREKDSLSALLDSDKKKKKK
ncbi:hypothetical protein GF373_10030 [bacterium]|nr:hypothetical protein [bacterium]